PVPGVLTPSSWRRSVLRAISVKAVLLALLAAFAGVTTAAATRSSLGEAGRRDSLWALSRVGAASPASDHKPVDMPEHPASHAARASAADAAKDQAGGNEQATGPAATTSPPFGLCT